MFQFLRQILMVPFLLAGFLLKLPFSLLMWFYRGIHFLLAALLGKTGVQILMILKWAIFATILVALRTYCLPEEIYGYVTSKPVGWILTIWLLYECGGLVSLWDRKPWANKHRQGHDYEYAVAKKLAWRGFHGIEVTRASGDFGADILAKKGFSSYAIQCKHYSNPVGVKAVQEALAGKAYYDCDKAMVITNSTFTPAAVELAKKSKVILWHHFRA